MVRLSVGLFCAALIIGAAGPGAFGELSTRTTSRDHAPYEAAVHYYSLIIEWQEVSKKRLGDAYYNRANAFSMLGRHVRAIQDYAQALRVSPNNADAHYNRGNAYAGLGNHDQAIADYSQAIRLEPDHHYAYYNRANSYLFLGDIQRATRDYEKAYFLDPDDIVYQDTVEEFGLSQ